MFNPNGASSASVELDTLEAGTSNLYFRMLRAWPDLDDSTSKGTRTWQESHSRSRSHNLHRIPVLSVSRPARRGPLFSGGTAHSPVHHIPPGKPPQPPRK